MSEIKRKQITVICREEGYPNSILIYVVDVVDIKSQATIIDAVQYERNADLGGDANAMEILFAFEGDLNPIQDWREE